MKSVDRIEMLGVLEIKEYALELHGGANIGTVLREALLLAVADDVVVTFQFNAVPFRVDPKKDSLESLDKVWIEAMHKRSRGEVVSV